MESYMYNGLEWQHSTQNRSHPKETMQELLGRLGKESNGDHHLVRLLPLISLNSSLQFEIDTIGQITAPTPDNQLESFKAINSCDCTNCSNKRNASELINRYENQKVRLITELNGLKSNSDQLEAQTSELNSRIVAYAESINAGGSVLAELQGKSSAIAKEQQNLGAGDFCPGQGNSSQTLQKDIRTLWTCRNALNKRILNKSDTICSPELAKQQEQTLTKTENNLKDKHDLEIQLEKSLEDNLFMVRKIKDLESIVKVVCGASKQTSAVNQHHCDDETTLGRDFISEEDPALQNLKLMKEAYDTNRNLIVVQEEQLHNKRHLISKYERFVRDLHRWIGNIVPNPRGPISENIDLSQTLDHLRACLQQVLADNGIISKKSEAVQQVLMSANRENALLNETVASLNDHIEELSQEHDKLVMEFQFNHTNCLNCSMQQSALLSGNSTPRADEVSQMFELEEKIGDDDKYLYSFSPQIPPPTYSPLSVPEVPLLPPAFVPCGRPDNSGISDSTACYVNNLKVMAKCLQELKSSSMILSPTSLSSLIPLPMGP